MSVICKTEEWKQPIETMPLVQAFPELGQVEEFQEKKVVLSEDHKRLFGVFSAKTPILPHQEVMETFSTALNDIYNKDLDIELTVLKKGAQVRAKVDLPDNIIDLGNGDTSHLRLYMYNSYDKGLPFVMRAGAFRHACENSMVLGTHIGKITSRDMVDSWSPEALGVKMERLIEKVNHVGSMWKVWAEKEIGFPTATEALGTKMPSKMLERFLDETIYPMSIWEFYNMLTQDITHGEYSDRARISYDGLISSIFYSPKNVIRQLSMSPEAERNFATEQNAAAEKALEEETAEMIN